MRWIIEGVFLEECHWSSYTTISFDGKTNYSYHESKQASPCPITFWRCCNSLFRSLIGEFSNSGWGNRWTSLYYLLLVNTRKDLRQILSIVSIVNSVSSVSKLGLRSEPGILPINTCFVERGAEHSGQYQITLCYAPSIFCQLTRVIN